MRKLLFFMMITANGLYERGPWEIDWHNTDEEFNEFAIEQLELMDVSRLRTQGTQPHWRRREEADRGHLGRALFGDGRYEDTR
jgi:hypothetical protein